jgi:hypothetical protein
MSVYKWLVVDHSLEVINNLSTNLCTIVEAGCQHE